MSLFIWSVREILLHLLISDLHPLVFLLPVSCRLLQVHSLFSLVQENERQTDHPLLYAAAALNVNSLVEMFQTSPAPTLVALKLLGTS